MTEFHKELHTLARGLRESIIVIAGRSTTVLRSKLEGYLKHISPSMSAGGDSNFPATVRKHKGNPERTAGATGKSDVLMFHVGNAVLAYYGSLLANEISDELRTRVLFLENVAAKGLENFKGAGSIQEGFFLSNPTTDPLWERKTNADKAPAAPAKVSGQQVRPPSTSGRAAGKSA